MSNLNTDVLMVFCEGPHDVAYTRKIFNHHFGFKQVSWKFSEFPYPFNNLFSTTIQEHAQGDLSLNMTHKFFLPDEVLEKDDSSILLFNTGGESKFNLIKGFLEKFLLQHNEKSFELGKKIGSLKYLFLYDADSRGVKEVQKSAHTNLSEVAYYDQYQDKNVPWNMGDWIVDAKNEFAYHNNEDKAIYVWCGKSGNGTLEDLLTPLFFRENANLFHKASEFVNGSFSWDLSNKNKKKAVAEKAKRSKAIFTAMGQEEKPGSSMAVILGQAKFLISENTWKEDENTLKFAEFVASFAKLTLIK